MLRVYRCGLRQLTDRKTRSCNSFLRFVAKWRLLLQSKSSARNSILLRVKSQFLSMQLLLDLFLLVAFCSRIACCFKVKLHLFDLLWTCCGLVVQHFDLLWICCGFVVDLLWICRTAFDLLWTCCGFVVDLLWTCCTACCTTNPQQIE